MPLKNEYPSIDDRRYSDLIAEVRSRVPRYTSEWTDLNENEPAMAVVEVFAWMTELLAYRLGKVPKLNYLKFLELLGIELTPARPAMAEVTFPVLQSFAEPYVIVPLHTQLETEEPDAQGRSIVFETERALVALTAPLDAIQTDNGVGFTDITALNENVGKGFHPFGPLARAGWSVLFGFNSTLDFPTVEINLMVWLDTGSSRDPLHVSCGEPVRPPATVQWEYFNGKEWRTLDLLKDETAAFSRSGHVYFNAPAKGEMVRSILGKVAGARYWIRARLVSGSYQRAPKVLAVRTNTAAVAQAETIDAEILGGSNGRAEQIFALANAPVLDGTLELVVDEGEGDRQWQQVDDFFASGPDSIHYVLNRTTGEVRFGDGRNGRIPVANPRRPANIIARRYRVGGGMRGNVGAAAITSLRGSVGGVDAGAIVNTFPAFGGGDEESLEQARDRVPRTLKSKDRAVTLEDFEHHARAAGGIARAKALPLFHPEFPGVEVPGVVSVIVVPEPADEEDVAPVPTQSTLRNVCAYLDSRRVATVELYVLAPRYCEITVSAELVCRNDADLAEAKQAALASLIGYFHPLHGGNEGSGWPFGDDIYYSLVLQRLLVDGVKRVARLELVLDGEKFAVCTDVPLDANCLLRNGVHELNVRYDDEA